VFYAAYAFYFQQALSLPQMTIAALSAKANAQTALPGGAVPVLYDFIDVNFVLFY